MPVMDGYEATINIKNDKKLKNIPVIALTASVMGKDLEKVAKYGFDGYLRKPVVIEDLIEELCKHLEYTLINKEIHIEETNEEINLVHLKELIEILDTQMTPQWSAIKDSGDFGSIEEFASQLHQISLEKDILLVSNYSKELLKNIEAFDIEKVDFLMNSYPNLVDSLKAKVS